MQDKKNKYKFLEHTADAKFQAYGKNLEEAFSNAALAMFSIMVDTDSVRPEIMKKIVVEAKNKKALLYSWLEELLVLLDSEMFLLNRIEKLEIKEAVKEADEEDEEDAEGGKQNILRISAVVAGDKSDKGYKLKGEVKAVTYNEMEIEEKENTMVQVVVDI